MSRTTLHPDLLWLGNGEFCYRLNPLHDDDSLEGGRSTVAVDNYGRSCSGGSRFNHQQLKPVGQIEEADDEGDDGGCGITNCAINTASANPSRTDEIDEQLADCRIESFNGGLRLHLQIPSAFHRFLIGRHGDTKRRLEAETGTELRIPRMGDTDSPVIVHAKTRSQLASAKTRIELLLGNARERLPITHFLSLKVASPEVVGRYREFRQSVLQWCGGERGVAAEVFQQPARLHVTCAPLLLLTSQEVARAKRMLEEFAKDELPKLVDTKGRGPLRVALRGLEIMNDDPSDTRVLYARLHDSPEGGQDHGRVQALADALSARFEGIARAQPGREGVKLHVTLMNARFATDDSTAPTDRAASFDAAHLMSKFADFDFGSAVIDSLQLSKSSGGAPRDEYYACEYRVLL